MYIKNPNVKYSILKGKHEHMFHSTLLACGVSHSRVTFFFLTLDAELVLQLWSFQAEAETRWSLS